MILSDRAAAPPAASSRWLSVSLVVGLTALALAARCAAIARFGVDVPFWDQWDGEIERLYFKYLDHTLAPADFFLPANEHRIVYTRLLNLGIFIASGERLLSVRVMYAQAVVSVVPLLVVLRALNRRRPQVLASLAVAVILGLPLSWENLYWGYQSQVYFALSFAVAGLALAARRDVPLLRVGLCVGLGAASMASAMFTAAAAAAACVLRGIAARRLAWAGRAALFAAMAYLASRTIVPNPGHAALRARSLGQFAATLWQYLCWPATPWGPVGLLAWGGAGAVLLRAARRRQPLAPEQWLGMLLVAWSALAAVAASYARAGSIGPRYYDYILLAYAGAALLAARHAAPTRRDRGIFGVLYLAALVAPLLAAQAQVTREAREVRAARRTLQAQVRSALLVSEGDAPAAYAVLRAHPGLGYPDDRRLSEILADPRTRHVLRALLPTTLSPAAAPAIPQTARRPPPGRG